MESVMEIFLHPPGGEDGIRKLSFDAYGRGWIDAAQHYSVNIDHAMNDGIERVMPQRRKQILVSDGFGTDFESELNLRADKWSLIK